MFLSSSSWSPYTQIFPQSYLGERSRTQWCVLYRTLGESSSTVLQLIGPPGVGKTAILEGLASRIVAKEVPESLQGKRVLSIDLSAIMAGSGIRGQFEEKFKALIKDIEDEVRGLYAYWYPLGLTRNRLAM